MTDTNNETERLASYFGEYADRISLDGKGLLIPYRTRQVFQHTCLFRPDEKGNDATFVPPVQIGFTEVYDRLSDRFIGIIDGAGQFIQGRKDQKGQFVCQALNPETKQVEIQTFQLADNILTDKEHTPGLREISYNYTKDWRPFGAPTNKEITPVSETLENQLREKGEETFQKEVLQAQNSEPIVEKPQGMRIVDRFPTGRLQCAWPDRWAKRYLRDRE